MRAQSFFMEPFHYKYVVFLLMLLFLEIFLINCDAAGRCLGAQNSTLLRLKKGFTTGKPESWQPGTDCCSWEGVTCDESGRIIELYLSFGYITGTIDPCLFNLTSLETLNLAYNDFSGIPIPDYGWDRLVNLSSLNLSFAGFAGKVPATISRLRKLTFLDLSFNFEHSLSINPMILRNMTSLKELRLDYINASSYMDEWCGILVNSTPKLELLSMFSCSLFGGICSSLPMLPFLSIVEFRDNNLESSIPHSFANFSSLSELSLANNNLTGEISPFICNLTKLMMLDLSNNKLTGTVPPCLLEGIHLEVLNLGGNQLHGTIPHGISSACKLLIINLKDNQLEGLLPRTLSNCLALEILDIGNNKLQDAFPYWLGNMSSLRILDLRSNMLYGLIGPPNGSYETNYAFSTMHVFDISSNNFSGNLSARCFSSFKFMITNEVDNASTVFIEPNVDLYDPTIMNKGQLMTMQNYYSTLPISIDLSNNHFEGEIPSIIGQFSYLQVLNMSQNYLTGEIPPALGNLVRLESLDLSKNNLYGKIPQEFVSLHFLSCLNLSYNKLVGTVPQGGQLCSFTKTSFEGNGRLDWFSCNTRVLVANNTTTSPLNLGGTSPNNRSYMIVLGILFGVGFGGSMAAVLILDVMFCNKARKRTSRPSHG